MRLMTFKANEDVIIVKNKNEKIKDFKIEKYIDIKNNNFYIDVYYDNLLHKRIRLTTDNDIKKANIFNIFYEILRKIFSN